MHCLGSRQLAPVSVLRVLWYLALPTLFVSACLCGLAWDDTLVALLSLCAVSPYRLVALEVAKEEAVSSLRHGRYTGKRTSAASSDWLVVHGASDFVYTLTNVTPGLLALRCETNCDVDARLAARSA
ncbi:hypothetical protein OH77DRAFT_1416337 [Trametes cingulata]|nr:hypothetical protein OH77DRAFT_1416337 [Trametes cingulata]